MPSGVLRGDLYLAYFHSQMYPQTSTKVGANAQLFICFVEPPETAEVKASDESKGEGMPLSRSQ